MIIYCDTSVLIYWLDQVGPFHIRARNRFQSLEAAKDQMAVSYLTRLEYRVGPLKRRDAAALKAFDDFFARSDVQLVPLSAAVFERAAQLRVDLNVKTPDALHLAAAIESSCGRFLTNDNRLSKCTDITVEVLPP